MPLTADELPTPIGPLWGIWQPKYKRWIKELGTLSRPFDAEYDTILRVTKHLVLYRDFSCLIVARTDNPTGHTMYKVTRDGVEVIEPPGEKP